MSNRPFEPTQAINTLRFPVVFNDYHCLKGNTSRKFFDRLYPEISFYNHTITTQKSIMTLAGIEHLQHGLDNKQINSSEQYTGSSGS
jgi:hypothetical protein